MLRICLATTPWGAEHHQDAGEPYAQSGQPPGGGVLVGKREHRHREREQRDGGVPDAGEHARHVLLPVREQRERDEVQEDRGNRELTPEARAGG